MDINVIGVPIMYGCDVKGVEFSPDKLRELGIVEKIQNDNNNVYDLGNIYVPSISSEDKYKDSKNMKYLEPIKDINRNLAHTVYLSLKSNAFPFVIGGDHSLGLGSIAGSSRFYNRMAVIWVDAHGDINSPITSPSGNIHGMPLAASMNVGEDDLTDIYYKGRKVRPEDVYIIGARDLDPGEVQLAKDLNINLYTKDIIKDKGLGNILNEVLIKIIKSQVDGVHFSFDIDSINPSLAPGTGTPAKGGFTVEEAEYTIKTILKSSLITSMDFVEFNPLLDKDNITGKLAIRLLELIGKYIHYNSKDFNQIINNKKSANF